MPDVEKRRARKKVIVGPVRKPREKYASTPKTKHVELSPDVSVFSSESSLSDGSSTIKTTDFVLVYNTNISEEAFKKIETFIFNLEQKGFELENATFSIDDTIIFIKIHAPKAVLLHFAELFNIELAFHNTGYKMKGRKPYKCMATELTHPDPYSSVFRRATHDLLGYRPTSITSAEKNLIIFKVLSRNPFGDNARECGINKLIDGKVFQEAYPLHDGPFEWSEEGPLNDRQLLARYWANMRNWYKQQPLDLIEKYYGPETAFYFAWAGFYNKMLIPVGFLGLGFFLIGMICFYPNFNTRNKEICESDLLLCPRCIVEHCKYEPLKSACFHTKLMYLFDNPLVITFAALMSIWSTLFFELWRREEAMLQIRWNLRSVEADCSTRPEFEEQATHFQLSPITGVMEPYVPKEQLICRHAITFSVIILLILLLALGIFGIMVYVKAISVVMAKRQKEVLLPVGLIASLSGAVVSLTLIFSFEFFYERIAMDLTKMECPRTQIDFDNSYTYKSYALAFVNNYSIIFYIAFLKARFYTYPGDEGMFKRLGGIGSDLCDPSGCIVELGTQLVMTLLGKRLVMTAQQYIIPRILLYVKKLSHKKKDSKITVQWESDYLLNPTVEYQIMREYMQMVIQYGFVTFFVAAFPPAPLLVLFNNLIEVRVDAFKITNAYRRPVAVKVPNLAAWNGILQAISYIGVATNAFVIAFTSEFVQKIIYREVITYDLRGYVSSILSAFNVSEFDRKFEPYKNVSVCFYPGKRYPPGHPRQYELTDEYWYVLTIKFLAVVVFEHVVMILTGITAYSIPDIPFSVKEHINFERDKIKEVKLRPLREAFFKEQDQRTTNIFKDL